MASLSEKPAVMLIAIWQVCK